MKNKGKVHEKAISFFAESCFNLTGKLMLGFKQNKSQNATVQKSECVARKGCVISKSMLRYTNSFKRSLRLHCIFSSDLIH